MAPSDEPKSFSVSGLSPEERDELDRILGVLDGGQRCSKEIEEEAVRTEQELVGPEGAEADGTPLRDIRSTVGKLNLPSRIKLAMFGGGSLRSALITDSSKIVQAAVLENPRIQLQEIEAFAKNPNVSEFVLREIGRNREWLSAASIKEALVWNPKTPIDLSMRLLPYIRIAELKKIGNTRNLPGAVVQAARKRVADGMKGH